MECSSKIPREKDPLAFWSSWMVSEALLLTLKASQDDKLLELVEVAAGWPYASPNHGGKIVSLKKENI